MRRALSALLLSAVAGPGVAQETPPQDPKPIVRPAPAAAPPAAATGVSPTAYGIETVVVVLNKSDHTATLLDPTDFEVVRTVPTGVGPHEAVVSADGRTLFVSNYGGEKAGSSITEIDLPSGEVRRTIGLGGNLRPHGMAVAPDGSLWVTTEESQSIVRLAPPDMTIEKVIRTGQQITHMIVLTPDGSRAFTANIGSGTVTAIDLATGATQSVATGKGAEGIDISPDGTEVWVANREEDDVAILDAKTLKILGRVPTGKFPIRVKFTPDGKTVLVSCARSNELRIIERESRKEIGRVPLDEVPIGILVLPGGRKALVASAQADQVTLVDLTARRVIGAFWTGREPDGMAWATWRETGKVRPGPLM